MDYAFLGPDGCPPAAILTLEFKYIFLTRTEICVSILCSLKSQNHITSTFFSDINAAGSIYTYENGSNQIMGEMYIVES